MADESANQSIKSGFSELDFARDVLSRAKKLARTQGYYPTRSAGPITKGRMTRTERLERELISRVGSGARPSKRDPQLLGNTLDDLFARNNWKKDVSVGSITAAWPQVVGTDIANHCEPETFVDGLLVVKASSSAWATQLRIITPRILSKIAEIIGPDIVHDLDIHGPVGRSFKRGPKTVRGRGPRDTWG
jgi:predicted nucleic acid-binding Zn ribbon protein